MINLLYPLNNCQVLISLFSSTVTTETICILNISEGRGRKWMRKEKKGGERIRWKRRAGERKVGKGDRKKRWDRRAGS